MEHMNDSFHVLLRNAVISVFSTKETPESVLTSLENADFVTKNLQFRHGKEGLEPIDPDRSHYGFRARLLRSDQRQARPEVRLIEEVEAAQ